MAASHLVLFVEEQSMEAFLQELLPRLLPQDRTFEIRGFQGKSDLLDRLQDRLKAYSSWLPEDWRIIVVVDRDDDDCKALKRKLEKIAADARVVSKSKSRNHQWQLVNRIAIEELEAWYFGEWQAVTSAYPRMPGNVPAKAQYRDPDDIRGGTWEAFERVMQKHGYFKSGLPKIEVAREIGRQFDPTRCHSKSFEIFHAALKEAIA